MLYASTSKGGTGGGGVGELRIKAESHTVPGGRFEPIESMKHSRRGAVTRLLQIDAFDLVVAGFCKQLHEHWFRALRSVHERLWSNLRQSYYIENTNIRVLKNSLAMSYVYEINKVVNKIIRAGSQQLVQNIIR